jgi:CheY-like chemotaxis protein
MKRILIVDDNEQNRYLLRTQIGASDYNIDEAHDGVEALAKARKSPPDLTISDLLMPVMDGYTLLREWRSDPKLRQIPFIIHTATYTDPMDEKLAMDLGADAFILKPAERESFLAQVRATLAAKRVTHPAPPKSQTKEEKKLLKEYSAILVRKLEEKSLELERTNRALQADVAKREPSPPVYMKSVTITV